MIFTKIWPRFDGWADGGREFWCHPGIIRGMATRLRRSGVDGLMKGPHQGHSAADERPRAGLFGRLGNGMSWGTRMFLTQAVVLVASIATAALVASIVGPPLFHEHLLQIGREIGATELPHIERAFTDAGVTSLTVGFMVALVLALLVSWYDTKRLRQPLEQLTAAASQVSAGDYAVRVPRAGFSSELDGVGVAFNDMAHRLDATEETRRRLLSDVAHEVRTPIATLTALLEALADDITPWNEETQHLLLLQAERLQRIARDLDAVSRAEEGRLSLIPEPVSISDLVKLAVSTTHSRYLDKGVALEEVSEPVPVMVDPLRIAQVLGNLLDNALRHTPPGGRVHVEGRQHAGTAVVTVTDTGDGLTADQLDHVFERFFRADLARRRDAAGAGIGLTISRGLAIAHHGSLTAASDGEEMGTTFTLTLPVATQTASPAGSPRQTACAPGPDGYGERHPGALGQRHGVET